MAKMMPTSYPGRAPLPSTMDDRHETTGKGPRSSEVERGGVASVDTPSFTHRQDTGPGEETHTRLPNPMRPKTPLPSGR